MRFFTTPLWSGLPNLTPVAVLDILVVAFVIYNFLMIVRGRRAAHILFGFAILAAVYGISILAGLELLRAIMASLAPYAPLALIVMFQSEIRRMLARLGRTRPLALGNRLQRREVVEEIVLALTQLASTKTGALVVIERDIGLRTFIESGVLLEAMLSRDLLLTIFQHESALHDGAVILQGDRVAAAACFLPLTVKPNLAREFGTRHRAAIGVTEETDCLALVVSEERGHISIAAFGELEMDVTAQRLQDRINEHMARRRWTHRPLRVSGLENMDRQPAHDPTGDY